MPGKPPEPQAIVIFGASGDLTRRKLLPAFYHLYLEGMLPGGFAIVGYSRTDLSDDEFRRRMRHAVGEHGRCEALDERWNEFASRLFYVSGEFDSEGAMDHLRDHLEEIDRKYDTEGRRFYYCSTPPAAYPQIVDRLGETGMHEGSRVVIEKPFGYDLESAKELNAALHKVFDEAQIFRIDHYLGKETVQNILALRFANGIFEPSWNRRYIDSVQITVAEEIGIEGRGKFFEETGTIRDMVQTHLFQVMTFVAMEPPISFDPDRLRDEKARVLRAANVCSPTRFVRGQYRGYRDEEDVAEDSQMETYAALELTIDNWRWAGVPFYLRTGKNLKRKMTELTLTFREVPYNVFKGTDATPLGPDHLTIRIQPDEGVTLGLNVKKPGVEFELDRATMDFDYESTFNTPLIEAYELLLLEAMDGDHSLFTREDEVERSWEILMPVLRDPPPVVEYEPGSWGPEEAEELILPRHWHVTHPSLGEDR